MALLKSKSVTRLANKMHDNFDSEARALTGKLFSTGGNIRTWERGMADLIQRHAVGQATLGNGGGLTAVDIAGINERLMKGIDGPASLERLVRFADDLAMSRMLHDDRFSEAQVAARAVSYGGDARALFFEKFIQSQSENKAIKWKYEAEPDACEPCAENAAGSPYAPDDCPLPGDDCLGGGFCRCEVSVA